MTRAARRRAGKARAALGRAWQPPDGRITPLREITRSHRAAGQLLLRVLEALEQLAVPDGRRNPTINVVLLQFAAIEYCNWRLPADRQWSTDDLIRVVAGMTGEQYPGVRKRITRVENEDVRWGARGAVARFGDPGGRTAPQHVIDVSAAVTNRDTAKLRDIAASSAAEAGAAFDALPPALRDNEGLRQILDNAATWARSAAKGEVWMPSREDGALRNRLRRRAPSAAAKALDEYARALAAGTPLGDLARRDPGTGRVLHEARDALRDLLRPASREDAAVAWLRELLADGPMTVDEIQQLAIAHRHKWRTVQRARSKAGVESFSKRPACWCLPADD